MIQWNSPSIFSTIAKSAGHPVVNSQGDYVGVLSKTDLSGKKVLDWVNHDLHLDAMLVNEVMSPHPPLVVEETESVPMAVKMMLDHRVHRVFVTNHHGKIIGVLSSFDVMRFIQLEDPTTPDIMPLNGMAHFPSPSDDSCNKSNLPEKSQDNETATTLPTADEKRKALEEQVAKLILKKHQDILQDVKIAEPSAAR